MTIDADTEALLRDEVARTGRSFKEVLNRAVRQALSARPRRAVRVEPLFEHAFPPELDSFNRLADAWDDEKTVVELGS